MARKRQDPPPLDETGVWKGHIQVGNDWLEAEINLWDIVGGFAVELRKGMRQKPEPTERDLLLREQAIQKGIALFREMLPQEMEKALPLAIKRAAQKALKRTIVEGEKQKVFVRNPPVRRGRPVGSRSKQTKNEQSG